MQGVWTKKAKLIEFIGNLPILYPQRFRTKEAQKSDVSDFSEAKSEVVTFFNKE